LLAEDEESDALILGRAFEKCRSGHPLVVVRDGQEAINYLGGRGPYEDRGRHPLPALLVLDLKMPRMSGFDVLSWISTRADLAHLPVVVLSSSSAEADMRKARELGASEYLVKPNLIAGYVSIVEGLHSRWLQPSRS
jgi:CheY-like chemotaxis protein